MATDRRRKALATATTGAALTTAGGVLRHKGIQAANRGRAPDFNLKHPVRTHPTRALLRAGARGRKRYALGATLGLVGAPAFAVGAHDYLTSKADTGQRRSFVAEGITGTRQAVAQRAQGMKEVPPQHRVGPLAVSAAAGYGGSLAAHRAMDKTRYFRGAHHGGRAGLAALAGTAAATASFPLARHAVRSRDYEVTPTGVRRRKSRAVPPSRKGTVYDQKRMSRRAFRDATVGTASKAETDYDPRTPVTPGESRRTVNSTTDRGWWAHSMHQDNPDHDVFLGPHRTEQEAKHDLESFWEDIDGSTDEDDQHDGGDVFHGLPPWAKEKVQPAIRAHTRGELAQRQKRDERGRFTKADYLGRHVTPRQQRAKTMAAGAIPIVPFAGPLGAARQAGRYAPPGEKHKAQGRQLASSAGTTAAGVGGAYWASSNAKVGRRAEQVQGGVQRAGRAVSKPMRRFKKPGPSRLGEMKARAGSRALRVAEKHPKAFTRAIRAAGPIAHNPKAALAGYTAGKLISGQPLGNLAISRNQAAQRRYDLKHPSGKVTAAKADTTGMSRREQQDLIRRKRRNLVGQQATAGLGLAGATMGAALLPGIRGKLHPKTVGRLERGAVGTGLVAGGIAGVHSLRNARLQRHELDAQSRALEDTKAARFSKSLEVLGVLQELHKADKQPLTRMREDQAHHIVRQYGTAGPLPKELGREDRMRAYEARYVHAGGHKAEHWQRRADVADKVKTGGLAGATAAGAGILALRHPRAVRALGHRAGNVHRAVDSAAIGAATVSGAGELYAGHARRRRSSYSNSKAGVAASALRRMRDYSG